MMQASQVHMSFDLDITMFLRYQFGSKAPEMVKIMQARWEERQNSVDKARQGQIGLGKGSIGLAKAPRHPFRMHLFEREGLYA